jgi:hypothetical protein
MQMKKTIYSFFIFFLVLIASVYAFCAGDPTTHQCKCWGTGYACYGPYPCSVPPYSCSECIWQSTPCSGSIAGKVKNTAGDPIAGATVVASGPSSGSDTTDSNGDYAISYLYEGSYTVTASAIGYTSQSKPAYVTNGSTTSVNFTLSLNCNNNGVCESNEIQPCSDCKTVVSIYPTYTYPGQQVTITVYFNDSRFDVDKIDYDVRIDLFISNIPWNSTNGCDIGGKKFRAEINCGCGVGGCTGKHGYYGSSEYWVDFVDGYAKVTATCKIPTTISIGSHTFRAIPVIYSSPIALASGEISFKVESPLRKILSDLQNRVTVFLKKITGLFIWGK